MPSIPGTPDTGKLAVGFIKDGQQEYMTFYVNDTSGGIFSGASTFLDAVAAAVTDDLMPDMFGSIQFNQLIFEDVRTVPFGGLAISINPAVAGGTSGTGNLPNSVSIAIKRSSAVLDRSGRGRVYWPSLDESVLDNGNTVTDEYVDTIIADMLVFQGDIEAFGADVLLGHVSYYVDGALRTEGVFHQTTNWSVTDHTVDNQRRRLPGRGN